MTDTVTTETVPTATRVATFTTLFASADASADNIVTSYRAIPAAARGNAMTSAMVAYIASGGSADIMASRLDAINNMPTASAARVRPTLSDADQGTIKYYVWIRTAESDELAFAQAFGGSAEQGSDDYNADGVAFLATHADLIASLTKRTGAMYDGLTIGDRTRTVLPTDLLGIVPSGATIVGTFKKADFSAVVNDDGTVTSGDVTGSVSSVATTVTGQKAVNGWRFWTYDGRTLADHRASADA